MADQTLQILRDLDPALQAVAFPMINALRQYGLPAVLVSGRRSGVHNAAVGGAENSRHLTGRAFDLAFYGYPTASLPRQLWEAIGMFGEGYGLRWGGRFQAYDPGHFDLG